MKYFKKLFLTILFLITAMLNAQQQFNTSNTNVDYEIGTGTLTITTRLYTNAIEKAIGEKTANKNAFDSKLKNYVNNKVDIKINNSPASISYNGFQVNDQTTRIYLKVEKINDINSLELKLPLLMDVYDDQQNFIKVDIKNNKKNFVIRKDSEIIKVVF